MPSPAHREPDLLRSTGMSAWKPKPRSTWTEHRRASHDAAVRRWHREHLAKLKVIRQRARMVYRLVHMEGVERSVARQQALARYPLPPEDRRA
jgi:2-polyprenyl-6-methoxyphenol hydroxylase-like FAD-dependent oxidoreductase